MWRLRGEKEGDEEEGRNGEVLFVNAAMRFHTLSDGSVVRHSPRDAALAAIRSLRPRMLVLAEKSMHTNDPFFLRRVSSAFDSFLPVFESIRESVPHDDDPSRRAFERLLVGREVVNVVACEGTQRVMRAEPVASWRGRMARGGFAPCELPRPAIWSTVMALLGSYSESYGLKEDGEALVLTWKEAQLLAVSGWRLAC